MRIKITIYWKQNILQTKQLISSRQKFINRILTLPLFSVCKTGCTWQNIFTATFYLNFWDINYVHLIKYSGGVGREAGKYKCSQRRYQKPLIIWQASTFYWSYLLPQTPGSSASWNISPLLPLHLCSCCFHYLSTLLDIFASMCCKHLVLNLSKINFLSLPPAQPSLLSHNTYLGEWYYPFP